MINNQRPIRPTTGNTALAAEDTAVLAAIRLITDKGNDAEVKKAKDGTLSVYEIKKNRVAVR